MIFNQNKIMVDFSMQNDSQSDIVITQPNLKAFNGCCDTSKVKQENISK
jgi:hypothetical protein